MEQEKSTILARLTGSPLPSSGASATGDSLTKTLHPPAVPLPGLPDLKKPVFLSQGSVVCENSNVVVGIQKQVNQALKDPMYTQAAVTMMKANHCTIASQDVHVSVLTSTSTDPEEYMLDKALQTVAIRWKNSDGSTDIAWTLASSLRN